MGLHHDELRPEGGSPTAAFQGLAVVAPGLMSSFFLGAVEHPMSSPGKPWTDNGKSEPSLQGPEAPKKKQGLDSAVRFSRWNSAASGDTVSRLTP